MKVIWFRLLVGLMVISSFSACQSSRMRARPLTLIEGGESRCVVVYDASNPAEAFAVRELQDIILGSTSVELRAVDVASPEAVQSAARIVLGRHRLTRELLGRERVDALREQESLVTRRGNDLVLTGGDDWGTIYAVYDFVENEAGYRCFAPYPGGESFRKADTLRFSGRETCRRPAFPGFRICYTSPLMNRETIKDFARYSFRNRGTRLDWEKYGEGSSFANDIGLVERYQQHVPGHSLFYYVPAHDKTWSFWRGSGKPALEGLFAKHPEYFTQNEKGERVDNAQLCFSNLELRKLFTERVREAISVKGDGVYMVGSNDFHGGTYCFCPGCLKLQERYDCTGGPLWDYILELCGELKDEHPGVFITSLAYKGAKQTEIAPDKIVFPENFICDAAFLNSSQTLTELKPVVFAGGLILNNFDKYANLKKWVSITDHVSYWYYGGGAPYQVYARMTKEMRELHAAGVQSVGSCGLGSFEFGDITTYLYLRLLIDPHLDAAALVHEFAEWKYGAAAPKMLAIVEELEQMRRDFIDDRTKAMFADESYDRMTFIEPERIVRWRRDFDAMLELVKDDPVRARNVRVARTAVDCWTIMTLPKIRREFPDEKIDIAEVLARGLASAEEAEEAGMTGKRSNRAVQVLGDMSLYAELKDDALPPELASHAKTSVVRYLPIRPRVWAAEKAALTKDPDAVTGWTMKEVVVNPKHTEDGCRIEYYDAFERKWLMQGTAIPKAEIVPNQYTMYKLFTNRLPSRCRLVFCGLWGKSLDIMSLGRYYDPSYHERHYEFWANVKFEGPMFDPESKATESTISCDQVFLVNVSAGERAPD